MHIREIEIDGFKSYAQKQVVGKFDEQFNAITGLNGSGKSNILDSICFVLGISNLAHIRAQSNNDLIFKQGNAGITKAFVKITFDNTGARKFAGHGDVVTITRTISIASSSSKGTNNYTINGSNSSSSIVADLFRSVGLNVNNPHFLIMQGRITKVLNMKPIEILGMIEEAAGTKMYDQKRNAAVSNMEKKDHKLEDIKQLMEQEILPTVQRMKDDREEYLKYQKYERDIETCKRKHSAFVYDRAQNHAKQCLEEIEIKEKEKEATKEAIAETEKEIEALMFSQKEQEKEKGGALKKEKDGMDGEVAARRTAATEAEKKFEDVKSALEAAESNVTRAEGTRASDMKAHSKLESDLKTREGELGGEEQRGMQLESEIKKAKEELLALEQGMTVNDAGQAVSLESQITEAKTRLTEQNTEARTKNDRIKDLERRKKDKEQELADHDKEDTEYINMKETLSKNLVSIQAELDKMNFNEAEYEGWKAEIESVSLDMKSHENTIRQIEQDMLGKEAQFRIVPGIDKDKDVLGMIPRFFKLKDDSDRHAIELLMGDHNGTTVVRSADVASVLMREKAFTRRTTCIPLDGRDETEAGKKSKRVKALQTARSIAPAGEKVDWAIDLVEFHPKHAYICNMKLEGVLVCDNPDTASAICYHRDVECRVITRNGEIDVSPSGVTGGGARASFTFGMDLTRMRKWHEAKEKLEEMKPRYNELEKLVKASEKTANKYNVMKEKKNTINEQTATLNAKYQFSTAATIRTDLEAINNELPILNAYMKNLQKEMADLKDKIAKFEERKKNEKAFADKEKSDCKKKLKDLQEEQKRAKGGFEKAKTTLSALRSELESLEQSVKDGEIAIEKFKNEVKEKRKEMEKLENESKDAQAAQEEAEKKRTEFIEKMKKHDEEINQIRKSIEKNRKDIQQKEAKFEELEREKKKLKDDEIAWTKEAKSELKANSWIAEMRVHFGQKGTDFDFTGYTLAGGQKKIDDMEAEMKKMNNHINVNTMNMLAPSEERVMALQKKREQIEKDRGKLMETIAKLDEKKKIELMAAYKSVNKDFNGIFSMLLPGTSAKLEAADGIDPLRGVEIKVAFNGKWKDSLGELSGGQRSLVALSLVLAMLKFRPAPLYILDEVDAALDLSHTQNIGAMIKAHFKESQFIIVSLKEGMFNHANVLFRTRFVDGTSQVSRTDNTKR